MARLIVTEFVTVDGVMEDPGGSEGSAHGGWAFRFERGREGDRFKYDELIAADAILLGRVTYEGFAAAWPERTGEFADKLNGMEKHVVSATLRDPAWANTTVIAPGELADRVSALRARAAGDVLVNGSAQLVRTLAEHDLVDEYRLMVFPVVLGEGKRLFDGTAREAPLRLADARPAGETVILTYVPRR
jgi:dihydrofolate reductase